MSLVLMTTISLVVAVGVLLVLSRDIFRLIVGLTVLSSATNLIVFMAAFVVGLVQDLKSYKNPYINTCQWRRPTLCRRHWY
jgi:multisubunit Na+/H+ antiporter MnhC subunit